MGGDCLGGPVLLGGLIVSIHAPAWGATRHSAGGSAPSRCFNPRPRMGGDLPNSLRRTSPSVFQSTPPRGGRPPRRRARIHRLDVSIHAPAWGATQGSRWHGLSCLSFNPRPRMGGDLLTWSAVGGSQAFQSTPPHGGRPESIGRSTVARIGFNPRPRMGGDFSRAESPEGALAFQSTATEIDVAGGIIRFLEKKAAAGKTKDRIRG